jgi:phosphatidylinositol-binding clathrin assembly protein
MLTVAFSVQTQGTNIRSYSDYLLERARAYRATKTDYVRVGAGKLSKLTVDKGLLRETEVVQDQIGTLLQCDVSSKIPTAAQPYLTVRSY